MAHSKMKPCSTCDGHAHGKSDRCRMCSEGAFLPAELVKPVLLRLIEDRNYTAEGSGGVGVLERETGLDAKRFYDLTGGRQTLVSFNLVDTLLSKTGNHMLWFEPPLHAYYHEPRTLKRRKAIRKFCKCGKRIRAANATCLDCRYAGCVVTRCACGNKMDEKSTQCLKCWRRKKAPENSHKWMKGESWQVPLTGKGRV